MTGKTTPVKIQPVKIQAGDICNLLPTPFSILVFKEPLDAHNYCLDKKNPKLSFNIDETKGYRGGVPLPVHNLQAMYFVSKVKDIFDSHGYRHRYLKVIPMTDNTALSGWISDASFQIEIAGAQSKQSISATKITPTKR